ncbi:AMP-binding protein [Viridibacterium curvum]|uniref:Xanthomonadin biosynthesis 3-hydroxybenozate--AMP ligase XanA2 n=1 Tax=Viridibacterium curvum TaxID=1101404 RepID=A0ABP9R1I1_9RHOO
MSAHALPLLPAAPADQPIAFHAGQPVSQAAFVRDVLANAQRITPDQPVLNLCGDRYFFAVGLFAAMLRRALCLLPNSVTPETLARLQAAHPGLQALVEPDGQTRGLPALTLQRDLAGPAPDSMPLVPADQIVARLYTSGSTGEPQAHDKSWGKLWANVRLAARAQWARAGQPCAIVSTVPSQHMYGFESAVLLPLLGGGILMPRHPFFPADVVETLAATPEPRALVSTPFHLRTLIESGLALPATQLVICATAPLSTELAERVELATGGVLGEIYGSTETGQIATRRPARSPVWECFDDVTLQQDTPDQGGRTWADGGHLEAAMPLGDIIELQPASAAGNVRFTLHGRLSDMINIAGKRTSIAFLNSVLCNIPGVEDGIFHLPEEAPADGVARLAAFAVAPSLDASQILTALRERIDAVFLPRPLILVTSLPRNTTGKLPRAVLENLLGESDKPT